MEMLLGVARSALVACGIHKKRAPPWETWEDAFISADVESDRVGLVSDHCAPTLDVHPYLMLTRLQRGQDSEGDP